MNDEGLRFFMDALNQLFALEQKVEQLTEAHSLQRNLDRLRNMFCEHLSLLGIEGAELSMHNPIGEAYDETRTDCSASIAGDSVDNLVVIEVIKPIIHLRQEGRNRIVQKGVVIVKGQTETA